jgi:3',5'-cyclic-AMP phosphodiesterase
MNFTWESETVAELQIIHLTDTHILDAANDTLYGLNTRETLQAVITQALSDFPQTDLLLFTGDISQTGSKSSYRIFQSIIEKLELPILCVPGNHDNPERLQQIIPSSPYQSTNFFENQNFSIALLNSCVDRAHYGELDDDCLNQLQQFLHTSDSRFHLIALHHAPVPIHSRWLDELGLQNGSRLLDILQGSATPSLLLCGHIHQQLDHQINQLRLLATPSTCHQFKARSDSLQCDKQSSAAYRSIKISLPDVIETSVHFVDCRAPRRKSSTRGLIQSSYPSISNRDG